MNKGWICPKCEAVMSPHHPTCWYCKPVNPVPKFELPDGDAVKSCDHDFLPDLNLSYPAKSKCRKCGAYMVTKEYMLQTNPLIDGY